MSSEPPKRHSSTELTAVRPRDSLPPISMAVGPTVDELADVARAHRDASDEAVTLLPCPACGVDCALCANARMVTPEVAARHEATRARVTKLSEPEDEPA